MADPTDPMQPVERREPTTMQLQRVGDAEAPESPESHDNYGLTVEDLATVAALRPQTALLVVVRGANVGARFLLDDAQVSAGRHPDSDIFLDDVTVSRRHAVFVREDGSYRVRDVGSLNGTYVNRSLVDEAVLRAGDEVQIGKFRLTYNPAR
ncbi:MAG TPA: FHA domain-containing protein [Dermatophilaceae bacterium]|jgi:pSer/pThr/pTyr-binding forkhead associated (FHA) protein|nr:FHA domain-containing protein [Dermatophilaceae bacterium]